MKKVLFCLAMVTVMLAQPDVEMRVLKGVQEMMTAEQGRVTFSDLHNDPRFGTEEKAFLGRLYEIFFQIPGFLKSEYESTGEIPTRRQMASGFGVSSMSVELLLKVMESDSRVPPLFERDPESGEITALKLDSIEAFVAQRGDQVKMTQWEGTTIPAFELTGINGRSVSSGDLEGINSLLYFWFSGCPPCVRIAPILADLDRKYRSSGFRIIGINADDILEIGTTEELRRNYLSRNHSEYVNLNLDKRTHEAFGNIKVYPTLFFVGPDLIVRKHLLNFQERETLEGIIREMIGP